MSTISIGPLRTTCPGALSFATVRSRLRASSATACESPPSIATIPPGCSAAASCIAAARSSTRRSASSNVSAPAACRAAYSPSECPAAATSWPPSCESQAHAQTRKIAGCCTRVPMPRSANGSYPRSSRPRSNSAVPRHVASMSAAWLPCPGKRSAEPLMHVIPHQDPLTVAEVRQSCGKCRTAERRRSDSRSPVSRARSASLEAKSLGKGSDGLNAQRVELRLGAPLAEDALQAGLGLVVDVRHRRRDGRVHRGDQPVHLVRDRAVARVPLAARAQLDQLHRLARVEIQDVADAVAEAQRVHRG